MKRPEIRFEGFDEEWEKRKLGDIADRVTEKNSSLVENETFTNSAEFGIISQRDFFNHDITNKDNIGNYYIVHPDDFVYNPRISVTAPVGPINRNKLGINGVMSPLYTVFRTRDIDAVYFDYYFKTDHWHSFMKLNGDSGARSDRFSIKTDLFYDMPIPSPTLEEQRKIGSCFEKLSNFITLHQLKLDKLQSLKKSMLEKMFPKEGETKPEIRFERYTDNWEQRKLYEVADFNPKSELPETFEYVDLESVVGTEMISHRTETRDTAPSRAQRWAQTGDVFFQTVRPYQRNNYLFAKPDNNYVFSTGYAQMRPKIDAEFLMCFLQTDSFVNVVLDNCTGTSYPAINSNDLSNLEISLPVSAEEQREIGRFVTNLDDLITLHQRKLESLQHLKSALFDKMFV